MNHLLKKYAYTECLIFLIFLFISTNGIQIKVGRNWTPIQLLFIFLIALYFLNIRQGFFKKLKFNKYGFVILISWVISILGSIICKPEQVVFSEFNALRGASSSLQSYELISYFYFAWLLLNILLCIVLYNLICTTSLVFQIFKVLIYSSAFFSVYGIYQYLIVSVLGVGAKNLVYILSEEYLFRGEIRLTSFSREPLYFINYLAIVFIVMIYGLLDADFLKRLQIRRKVFNILLLINSVALILTKSTGGFISLAVAIGLMLLLSFHKNRRRVVGLFVVSTAFLTVFFVLNQNTVQRKLLSMTQVSSGYVRVKSILEGVDIFNDNWLTGIGLGSSPYFISTQQVHNAYLSQAVETGVFGISLFLVFNIYLSRKLYANYKRHDNAFSVIILCCICYYLVQWLSFYLINVPGPWIVYSLGFIALRLSPENELKV